MADPSKPTDEKIKVVDRRHFTADGERRSDVPQDDAAKQAESRNSAAKGEAPATPREEPLRETAPTPSIGFEAGPGVTPKADFAALVGSFYRSALALLGGFADPETGHAIVDLEGARHVIDLLDVLAEKTAGNLTSEEARILREVKAELKLAYLNVAQATAQVLREQAKTQS
jgi:hypothetical protein